MLISSCPKIQSAYQKISSKSKQGLNNKDLAARHINYSGKIDRRGDEECHKDKN